MFKSNITKSTARIFLVLLISFWVIGCSTAPEAELTDIDNVLTEKQKKETRAQAKATEETQITQSPNAQTLTSSNKPLYPVVPPTVAVMRPVTVPPNPVVVAKDSATSQQTQNPTEEDSTATA